MEFVVCLLLMLFPDFSSKDILHRDLKSKNIFFTNDFRVKIGDFGLATMRTFTPHAADDSQIGHLEENNAAKLRNLNIDSNTGTEIMEPKGSILWMAPEILRTRPPKYSTKSDVYAFGVVLYELTSRKLPYPGLCTEAIVFLVGTGKLRPNINDVRKDTPRVLRRLLLETTESDLILRPPFKEIFQLLSSQPSISRSVSHPVSLKCDINFNASGREVTDEETE